MNDLYRMLQDSIEHRYAPNLQDRTPVYREFRAGDVRHSLADIGKAKRILGYSPTHTIEEGLQAAIGWYVSQSRELLVESSLSFEILKEFSSSLPWESGACSSVSSLLFAIEITAWIEASAAGRSTFAEYIWFVAEHNADKRSGSSVTEKTIAAEKQTH